jgi:hypothetical protein
MTENFKNMLYLFSCGARNKKAVNIKDINFDELYRCAKIHGVWQFVYLAIKDIAADDVVLTWRNEILLQLFNVSKKRLMINKCLVLLEKNNIDYCVLKGETLAQLYCEPDCRISSDTDILIDKRNEKKALNIMKSNGFIIVPRNAMNNQTVCWHPDAGTIEFHISINTDIMDKIWFNNMVYEEEERRIFEKEGFSYKILGITDGLIYVTLHFIKHFINKAAGTRMIMDVLLYMENYYDRINWNRFWKLMGNLKYTTFINVILSIGKEYLGIDFMESADESVLAEKVLTDIEEGGNVGFKSIENKGFYKIYTKKRYERYNKWSYNLYMKKITIFRFFYNLFPNRTNMQKEYRYLTGKGYLLPVAWLHRIIKLLIGIAKGEKSFKNYISQGKTLANNDIIIKRMDLIRELDMI